MEREWRCFVEDILEAMTKIARYIDGMDYNEFMNNPIVMDAVLRNIEIIGEAVQKIPQDIKEKYPDIYWRNMKDLRNIVIHNYFGIDFNIIWEVIARNIPAEKVKIEKIDITKGK